MKLALLLVFALQQDDKVERLAIKAGKIYTISKGIVEDGVILVRDGKIEKIGRGIDIPPGVKTIDLGKNASITPGFIDLHSHLGSVFEVNENVEAVTPRIRAIDGFTSDHPDVLAARSSGVTTIVIAPGNGNLVGGRFGLIRPTGEALHRILYRDSAGLKLSISADALLRDREPTSRAGAIELLRRHLRDGDGDVHQMLVKRSEPALIHVSTADDIQRAAALRQEFKLRGILVHADQAVRVLDDLRNSGAPVAFGPLTVSDARERLETPARLVKAGVRIGFCSDAPATDESNLRVSAALAVKYGLDRDDALRALTSWPAEMLGLTETGTLEEGKLADFVGFGGEPLSLASDVELVVIGGKIVHQAKK